MRYEASLSVKDDPNLYEAIKVEAKKMPRSSVDITKKDDELIVHVYAKDATAFRASMNTVMKLLIVHEKMTVVKNGRHIKGNRG